MPPDNGARIRTQRLLQGIASRHEVDLVTLLPPVGGADSGALVAAGLCSREFVVQHRPFRVGAWRRRLGLFGPAPSHIAASRVADLDRLTMRLAEEGEYAVVVSSTTAVAEAVRHVPSRVRVLEEHNCQARMLRERHERSVGRLQRLRTWLTWRKDVAWERRLFAAFDLVTMVSEQDRAAARGMGCPTVRIEVVPNGADCARLAGVRPVAEGPKLIYPGAVSYEANLEAVAWFAERVLPLLRCNLPGVELVVTGSADQRHVDRLEPLGLRFSGRVTDVYPLIAGSGVCVVPLLTGGGTRIKVLEAMALGTPIVTTRKGVEGLEAVHCVHCLIADDPAGLAASVQSLIADPLLRSRLSENALALVRARYDWAAIGRQFVSLLEGLAG